MYTIIKKDYIKIQVGLASEKMLRVDVVCDTEADLPEADPKWSQGSTAWIIDTASLKMLNSAGEWVGK